MATTGRYLYAIRIEGIGDDTAATASNKLYRWSWSRNFFDAPSTSDPDSLYIAGGPLLRWPRELEFSVDFRRGEPTLGSLTFELRRTSDVLTHFWAGTPAVTAKFNGAVSATATSVVLDTASLGTPTLYAGREALLLGSESPSKTYAVTRARLQTNAQKHDDGVQLYSTMHPTSLQGRLVELLRVPLDSTGYADEEVRWAGVLRKVYGAGAGRTVLEVDSGLALLNATDIYVNPWTLTVGRTPPEGGDALPSAGYGSHPRTDTSTSKALVMANDETALVLGYKTRSDGELDGTFVNRGELAGQPTLETLRGARLREIFSNHPAAPSNNATPSTLTLPLQGDLGKMLLQLALTTANDGTSGAGDATYDTGINALAGSIPAALIDKTAFEDFGTTHEPLDTFFIGHEGPDPVNLGEVFRETLGARGGSPLQAQGGKIGVVQLADAAVYNTTNTITQSQVLSVGDDLVQDRKLEDVAERITMRYNDRPGIGPDIINSTDVVNERLLPRGASRRLEVSARGLSSRSHALVLLEAMVTRFHAPIYEYTIQALRTADYWPGDVVSITHDKLIAGSTVGLTDAVCLVTARREKLDETGHSIGYRLLYMGELFAAVGYIAPSGKVASWDGGTNTITLDANEYTDSGSTVMATDRAGFVVDDVIQLCDQFGTVRDAAATVTAVSGNDITVSGMGVTPAAGDIVRVAKYSSAATSQQGDWAFISEADGTLSSDDAKEYVT